MAERRLGVLTVIEYPLDSDSFVLIEETKPHKRRRLNHAGGEVDDATSKKAAPRKALREESLFDAAVREAREESGLEVELTYFLGMFDYRKDGVLQIAFAAQAIGGRLQASKKHPSVEAYPYDYIRDVLDPAGALRSDRVLAAIDQYREHPLPLECVHLLGANVLPKATQFPMAQAA